MFGRFGGSGCARPAGRKRRLSARARHGCHPIRSLGERPGGEVRPAPSAALPCVKPARARHTARWRTPSDGSCGCRSTKRSPGICRRPFTATKQGDGNWARKTAATPAPGSPGRWTLFASCRRAARTLPLGARFARTGCSPGPLLCLPEAGSRRRSLLGPARLRQPRDRHLAPFARNRHIASTPDVWCARTTLPPGGEVRRSVVREEGRVPRGRSATRALGLPAAPPRRPDSVRGQRGRTTPPNAASRSSSRSGAWTERGWRACSTSARWLASRRTAGCSMTLAPGTGVRRRKTLLSGCRGALARSVSVLGIPLFPKERRPLPLLRARLLRGRGDPHPDREGRPPPPGVGGLPTPRLAQGRPVRT